MRETRNATQPPAHSTQHTASGEKIQILLQTTNYYHKNIQCSVKWMRNRKKTKIPIRMWMDLTKKKSIAPSDEVSTSASTEIRITNHRLFYYTNKKGSSVRMILLQMRNSRYRWTQYSAFFCVLNTPFKWWKWEWEWQRSSQKVRLGLGLDQEYRKNRRYSDEGLHTTCIPCPCSY